MIEPFLLTDVEDKQRLTGRLDLYEETIFMSRYDHTGNVSSCYEVDPSSLVSAFKGTPISTGILPPNTVHYSMVDGRESIAIYIRPTVWTLTNKDKGKPARVFRIPMPPLLFHGRDRTFRIWAVRDYPNENTKVYHAPLPNVAIGGAICRGNAKFPAASRQTIRQCFRAFIRSNFNDHLIGEKSLARRDDIREMWECLNHRSILYPLDDLIRQNRATYGTRALRATVGRVLQKAEVR